MDIPGEADIVKISGDKRHRDRLKAARGQRIVAEIGKRVFVAADSVRGEAQFLIAQGSIQGAGHQPSKPGEAPNLDTGVLTAGITSHRTGALTAIAESAAPHAVPLETGTSKMAARPYMAPAAAKVRADFAKSVRDGLNFTIRKG